MCINEQFCISFHNQICDNLDSNQEVNAEEDWDVWGRVLNLNALKLFLWTNAIGFQSIVGG